MNEVLKTLRERRSIRKYTSTAVPKELISEVIDAGLYAPSAMGTQNTAVIAVTDKKLRDRISAMNAAIMGREGFDPFYGAPVILIVLAKKDWANRVYDGSLVMGNLLNAAHAVGLGGIWIHRAKEEFESADGKAILSELGLSDEWEGIGHCALGYADGTSPAAAPRKENRVIWA
ncbi:MAG: nitroreductase [Treponema sp.]|nr:nitroreductase [Treponema sp.]